MLRREFSLSFTKRNNVTREHVVFFMRTFVHEKYTHRRDCSTRRVSVAFSSCRLRVPPSDALYCLRTRTRRLMRVHVRACVSPIDLRGATPRRAHALSCDWGECLEGILIFTCCRRRAAPCKASLSVCVPPRTSFRSSLSHIVDSAVAPTRLDRQLVAPL